MGSLPFIYLDHILDSFDVSGARNNNHERFIIDVPGARENWFKEHALT